VRFKPQYGAGNRYITVHATQEAVSDGIDPRRLPDAIIWDAAELIENYPGDPRGPSCLILTHLDGLPIHVVCSRPPRVVIITVYRPDPARWREDYKVRR